MRLHLLLPRSKAESRDSMRGGAEVWALTCRMISFCSSPGRSVNRRRRGAHFGMSRPSTGVCDAISAKSIACAGGMRYKSGDARVGDADSELIVVGGACVCDGAKGDGRVEARDQRIRCGVILLAMSRERPQGEIDCASLAKRAK